MNTPQSPQDLLDRMDAQDRQPDVDAAWRRFEQKHFAPRRRTVGWRQVAAAVAGIIFAAGLVVAAVQWARHTDAVPQQDDSTGVVVAATSQQADSVLCFDNTRLDSLLNVMAAHYGMAVQFDDERTASLRFYLTLSTQEPVEALLQRLNQFDGLQLSVKGDTIYVRREEVQP